MAQGTFNVVYNLSVNQGWPDPGGAVGYSAQEISGAYRMFGGEVSLNTYTKPFVADFDGQGQLISTTQLFSSINKHEEFGEHSAVLHEGVPNYSFVTEFNGPYMSSNLYLIRIGVDGDTLATILVQDTGSVSIKQSNITGNGLISGVGSRIDLQVDSSQHALFILTDTMGGIYESKSYGQGYLRRVEEYLDDGFIITGTDYTTNVDRGLIIRVDSLGNEIWRNNYGGWGRSQEEFMYFQMEISL